MSAARTAGCTLRVGLGAGPRRQKRNKGAWHLARHTDHHVLGLFPRATWDEALRSFPGEMQMVKVPDLYDAFILGDNEYLLRVFVGVRR